MSTIAFRNRVKERPWVDDPTVDDREDDPYALIIIVKELKDPSTGQEIVPEDHYVRAASDALVALLGEYGDDHIVTKRLDAWLDTRIRKLVKRAKPSRFDAIKNDHTLSLVTRSCHDAEVMVLAPLRRSEQPLSVRKLQVSGFTTRTRAYDVTASGPHLHVIVNGALNMTTGKIIAQYGHAVQLAFQSLSDDDYATWMAHGFATDYDLADPSPDDPIIVHDAGYTEIASNSFTASATMIA
jgi:hypothetical protein